MNSAWEWQDGQERQTILHRLIFGIFWLHFCEVGGSCDGTDIFLSVFSDTFFRLLSVITYQKKLQTLTTHTSISSFCISTVPTTVNRLLLLKLMLELLQLALWQLSDICNTQYPHIKTHLRHFNSCTEFKHVILIHGDITIFTKCSLFYFRTLFVSSLLNWTRQSMRKEWCHACSLI